MTGALPIRTIAVAGGGMVGLSAAIAFARALPQTQVTIIDTPPDPAALADLLPTTWPAVERFHAAIGLDEPELVRSGIATHHLGTIFEGWPGEWVHAFGAYGKPAGAIPFDQVWSRARLAGEALAYDRYSPGAALARAGKFVHPASDRDSLGSRFRFGLRLDPQRYRDRLKLLARETHVAMRPGEIGGIELRHDGIEALLLTDGSRVEADLFVDCTGPAARVLSEVDDSFEDWSAWMPFERFAFGLDEGPDVPSPADRVRASDEGWSGRWPLRGRTLTAEATLDGEGIAIVRGRRLRPWVHNVLALGDAATALDPLHGMNLDLAQQAILLALELLPDRDFNPIETDEYNRRAEQVTRRVRDFVLLNYLRSGRAGGIWAKLAAREPPDSLARTIDQYSYRGRLPFHEEESVTRDSWTAALIAIGVVPRISDPQAMGVLLDEAVPAMRRFAAEIDDTVARLPGYADYLLRFTR